MIWKASVFQREYKNDRPGKNDCPQVQNTSWSQLASVFGSNMGCEGRSPALVPLCFLRGVHLHWGRVASQCQNAVLGRSDRLCPQQWQGHSLQRWDDKCLSLTDGSSALLRHHWPVEAALTHLSVTSKVCQHAQAVKSLVSISCLQQNVIHVSTVGDVSLLLDLRAPSFS